MNLENAQDYFNLLAAHGRDLHLRDAAGAWEFDVRGAGTWTVGIDHGALRVSAGACVSQGTDPVVHVELTESELLRLARGEEHENILTAFLRGAVRARGDFRFAARLQSILPVPDAWRQS